MLVTRVGPQLRKWPTAGVAEVRCQGGPVDQPAGGDPGSYLVQAVAADHPLEADADVVREQTLVTAAGSICGVPMLVSKWHAWISLSGIGFVCLMQGLRPRDRAAGQGQQVAARSVARRRAKKAVRRTIHRESDR